MQVGRYQRWIRKTRGPQFYEEWMEKEGIPIYDEGVHCIEDITELPRRPWARMGGSGTFIQLEGTKQAYKLCYMMEIPAGGALEPEKHLYDELIYIVRGRGLAEVWQEGGSKRSFEWGEGALFAMPTNAWHRLVNGGREPALCFAVTNAPAVLNAFHNTDFIFNCDYNFTDRYKGQADYFLARENKLDENGRPTYWQTNFIADVRSSLFRDNPSSSPDRKAEGGQGAQFRMDAWSGMHSSEWPSGKYHAAHYHYAGAVLLGLKGEGYVLVWDCRYGIHPYQDGHGDKVVKGHWKVNSIYSPCNVWFHQHFNTGPEPARHLAVTGGGIEGRNDFTRGDRSYYSEEVPKNIRAGGNLIVHEDEDPEIRRVFQEELRQNGVEFTMEPVVYRTDPFNEPLS